MVRLLDTAEVNPAERKSAYVDQFFDHEVPHWIGFDDSSGGYSGVVDFWELDPSTKMHRTIDTGTRLLRTDHQLRISAPERLSIVLKLDGNANVRVRNSEFRARPGDMWLQDQTAASDYDSRGPGGVEALIIDYDQLAVKIDLVRRALGNEQSSPVYQLFRDHMMGLFSQADQLASDDTSRGFVTSATLSMVRALITTSAGSNVVGREALHDSEEARVQAYIRRNLRDADMNANSIAHANGITVRQLYKIWSSHPTTLAKHVLRSRLEGAREDLANAALHHATNAEIAASWGFADPSYFERQFLGAFGVSAIEFRQEMGKTN